jgi:hypothetical protein
MHSTLLILLEVNHMQAVPVTWHCHVHLSSVLCDNAAAQRVVQLGC